MSGGVSDRFERWIAELEARHLVDLTFPQVSSALRALSSAYVERRSALARGAALSGAGKRAAFALFYGPLHFLLVRHIVESIPGATAAARHLVDLGCGTGASGAAWGAACRSTPRIIGIDRNPWALAEAARTYAAFGLRFEIRRGDVARDRRSRVPGLVLAACTVNELSEQTRDSLLDRLLERGSSGDRVLVIEPLARRIAPWWSRWADAFLAVGGRADEWRLRAELPAVVAKLDRATGLNHREVTGRSLWCGRSSD
jgi:methyltransferase family protein